jgi:hypothetical protein
MTRARAPRQAKARAKIPYYKLQTLCRTTGTDEIIEVCETYGLVSEHELALMRRELNRERLGVRRLTALPSFYCMIIPVDSVRF